MRQSGSSLKIQDTTRIDRPVVSSKMRPQDPSITSLA